MNPQMQAAQAQAMDQKKAEEENKMKMFLDWLRSKTATSPQQKKLTSPAGGYISKEYTRNRLDRAGDY
ncbi:MAG: hypothetical protein SVV67_08805 [Bacillota bacterium]|nr:hypothetical protein [Bacillota bacterium]